MSHRFHAPAIVLHAARTAWLVTVACGTAPDADVLTQPKAASRLSEEGGDGPDAEPELVEAATLPPDLERASDGPRVAIENGTLLGATSNGVERFLGIPFASPPLGDLRFQPPAPPDPLQGERDASAPRGFCVQNDFALRPAGDEDCLYLNVYRPAETDPSSRLPVMVWIHGGSFKNGAGSDYDPQRLARQNGIVVVTINYRLGALGFLTLPATAGAQPISSNHGLMDQQEALRWVQRNIQQFGGDPGRVTIQGQSAGGVSVCAHLASPTARGLFSQAVIQSASCLSAPLAVAEGGGVAIAQAIPDCAGMTDLTQCVRGLPAGKLASLDLNPLVAWGPVVDGDLLTAAPNDAVQNGEQHPVPVLIGSVSDEMRGFFASARTASNADYPGTVAALFPNVATDEIVSRYPPDNPALYPEPFLALTAALSDSSDALGSCATARLADALAASVTTYSYELDDPRFVSPITFSPVPGTSHSSDLIFLFEASTFGTPISSPPFDAAQTALAEQMVRAWGSFIRTGNPNEPGESIWPPHTTAEPQVLHLEPGAVKATDDVRARHQCDFWEGQR